MQQLGLHALLSLFIYFVTTALAFQAIKCLDLSKLFKIKKIFENFIYLFSTWLRLFSRAIFYRVHGLFFNTNKSF